MKLKYLSLCLLGLTLGGCSSHVIKSNSIQSHSTTMQRVVDGVNAIYEYPEFDYRGDVTMQLAVDSSALNRQNSQKIITLDQVLQKKIDQYLAQQNIKLNSAQKKEVLKSIQQYQTEASSASSLDSLKSVENFFHHLKFNYDGTVNYRQQIATFNVDAQYKKDNLSVQARIPSVIDFKNLKFYSNISGVLPFLTDAQNSNKFSYFDLSQYRDLVSDIDKKALMHVIKEANTVPYLLTPESQFEKIALSPDEKNLGGVDKIRLRSTVDEWTLQSELFGLVNRVYLVNSVMKIDEAKLTKISKTFSKIDEDAIPAALQESQADPEVAAEHAMLSLYQAVESHFSEQAESDSADDHEVVEAEAQSLSDLETAEQVNASDEVSDKASDDDMDHEISAQQDTSLEGLSEEDCTALVQSNARVKMGDAEYCKQHYALELIAEPSSQEAQRLTDARANLEQVFSVYNQGNLINAEHFKQLWDTHLPEINQVLSESKQRNPIVIDVVLDAQGRAIDMDYMIEMDLQEKVYPTKLKMNINMEVHNYGQASKIDRQQLRNAQPFQEAFKKSALAKKLNLTDESSGEISAFSWEEQLSALAKQVYLSTGSYEKTYKAIFIAKLTAEQPELAKYYSAQDLQEIAAVYAYRFSDEERYSLEGQALQHNEALQKKHHLMLEAEYSFDESLGSETDQIVSTVIDAQQHTYALQKLKKSYKSDHAVFSNYYRQQFLQNHELSEDDIDSARLNKTADVLGHAYVALKHNKFDSDVIQKLQQDDLIYIDYTLFKQLYKAMLNIDLK